MARNLVLKLLSLFACHLLWVAIQLVVDDFVIVVVVVGYCGGGWFGVGVARLPCRLCAMRLISHPLGLAWAYCG